MPARTRTTMIAAVLALMAALTGAAPHLSKQTAARADNCATTLFTSGGNGYATYRAPAVVRTGTTLVVVAEGRRNSSADNGDIEVVERRSTDGGCTWSPLQVAADAWHDTVDNPVLLAATDGTLILVTCWQRGTVTQDQIQAGDVAPVDGRRVFVQTSTDAGATWSKRREITSQVKNPDWLWYATGPGHGLTITRGKAVGRLVIAADHTLPADAPGGHTLLSDDNGRTWRIGAVDDHAAIDPIHPDETTVAELPDARLYFSSRQQYGSAPEHRAYTYSLNSGSSYSAPFRPLVGFTTPVVEGSLLQDPGYPAGVTCAPLLYSGPGDPDTRQYEIVRRSDDAGLTWRTIAQLTGPTTPAAYSDLVKVDRTTVGDAFETGTTAANERIDWTMFTLGCP